MPQKMAVAVTALVAAGAMCLSAAPSGVIGMISGQSGVSIDGARVSGNATVFDGSVISSSSYSRMQLNSGARVDLSTGSQARVFSNHIALESGTSEVQSPSSFSIDARNYRIQPAEASSIARVRLEADQKVLVTAVSAPVNVWNRYGVLVARVTPAAPMAFLPQAAASTAFSNSGCVVNKANAPVLVDQTGNQVVELRSSAKGVDLRKFVGKHASVTGNVISSATPVQGASQVVGVNSIGAASGGGDCSQVAARVGATMSAAGIAAGGAAAAGAAAGAAGAAGAAAGAAAGVSAAAIGGIVGAAALGTVITAVAVHSNSPQ